MHVVSTEINDFPIKQEGKSHTTLNLIVCFNFQSIISTLLPQILED
jgi:hypothetical protein